MYGFRFLHREFKFPDGDGLAAGEAAGVGAGVGAGGQGCGVQVAFYPVRCIGQQPGQIEFTPAAATVAIAGKGLDDVTVFISKGDSHRADEAVGCKCAGVKGV